MTTQPHPLAGADKNGAQTPIADLASMAITLMAQGGAMRIMDLPDDPTYSSHTFSGEVSRAIAARILSALEAPTPPADVAGLVDRAKVIILNSGAMGVAIPSGETGRDTVLRALTALSARVAELEGDIAVQTRYARDYRSAMEVADAMLGRAIAREEAAEAALAEARDAALEEAATKVIEVANEPCFKCGNPRSNHPYRHPFVSAGQADLATAIRAMKGKP